MLKRLFHLSHWFHKYVGLLLILYGILMGVSGIFVNHPEWISGLSVPRVLVPPQYPPENFDRSTLAQLVYSSRDSNRAYLAGTRGVWVTTDGAVTFHPMNEGLPENIPSLVTNAILLHETDNALLLAGTEAGLYACDPEIGQWSRIPLGDKDKSVRTIFMVDDSILVFTTSAMWQASAHDASLDFERVDASRSIDPESGPQRVSLIFLFFDLHSGAILGLPGRLVVDAAGIIIIFLCFSAFYLWIYPWRRRRKQRASRRKKTRAKTGSPPQSSSRAAPTKKRKKIGQILFRSLFKYHLKFGIWVAPIFIILSATGLFMRPPLLMIPAQGSAPAALYPDTPPAEAWETRIARAVHDPAHNRILIEASDGFWATPANNLTQPFVPVELPVPIHVMGTTLLDTDEQGNLIVGSFSGGFRYDNETGTVIDLLTGQEAHGVSTMRSARHMVTAYFTTPRGERFVTTFHDGLMPLGDAETAGRFEMPAAMVEDYRMPLWTYMFELHNGRFFRDWMGQWYKLIPILGSLLFLLLTLTGIFDWLMIRLVLPWQKKTHRKKLRAPRTR